MRSEFGPHGGRLLADAAGRSPVVVLGVRSRERFAELRGAALVEWSRIRRQLPRAS